MPVDSIARGMAAAALANGGSGALTVGTSGVSGATAGQLLLSDGTTLQAGGAGKLSSLALGGATPGSNALAVTGSAAISGAISAPSITTPGTSLTLSQTGDTYGTTSLSLQNRTGLNGALFTNVGLGLVDFAFASTSAGNQSNIRAEFRGGSQVFGSSATYGEFQFLNPSLGVPYVAVGSAGTIGLLNSAGNLVALQINAANILAQVNGTSANTFRVYNTSSSSNANFARGVFDTTTANTLTIGTETLGTGVGTFGKIKFVSEGVNVLDYGVTASGAVSIPNSQFIVQSTVKTTGSFDLNFIAVGAHNINFSPNSGTALTLDPNQNIILGKQAALPTGTGNGFVYLPTCAGTPTGTPTAFTGMVPIIYDTSANKLWAYRGGAWAGVAI